MSKQEEQRKSFRMLDTVHLTYEEIDESTFRKGLERWRLQLGSGAGVASKLLDIDARFGEKLLILQTESNPAAAALILLNNKINAVIDELPEMRAPKMTLAQQEPQTCEIGADGMLFGADREFAPGTKLALRFLLASDSRYIESFCEVVRLTDSPADADAMLPYGIAVKFVGMHSAQKDVIVQHLFDRESETLRMRRLSLDAC